MLEVTTCFTYAYSDGTLSDFYQAITADAASTNYIDLDAANLDIASGKPIYIIASIGDTDWATIVSLEIRLETDTDTTFSTAKKDYLMGRWALAQLTAGALLLNTPLPVMLYQRYLRVYFNVFTSASPAADILVYLAAGPESAVLQVDHVEAAS